MVLQTSEPETEHN